MCCGCLNSHQFHSVQNENQAILKITLGRLQSGAGGGGRDEVWGRETMFSQLAKRSPCVVVSGQLQYFSHSKYF